MDLGFCTIIKSTDDGDVDDGERLDKCITSIALSGRFLLLYYGTAAERREWVETCDLPCSILYKAHFRSSSSSGVQNFSSRL